MRLSESMTSIGNGHMGMRGNFEERYSGDSHRGTYLAGVWFPDKTRVGWWKNGYPQYFGKVINAMNIISLRVRHRQGGHRSVRGRRGFLPPVSGYARGRAHPRIVIRREKRARCASPSSASFPWRGRS